MQLIPKKKDIIPSSGRLFCACLVCRSLYSVSGRVRLFLFPLLELLVMLTVSVALSFNI